MKKYIHEISVSSLEKVIYAYSNEVTIHIVYVNDKNRMSLRNIHIVDYIPKNNLIVAYCYLVKEIRFFKLNRIFNTYLNRNYSQELIDDIDYLLSTDRGFKFGKIRRLMLKKTILKIRYLDIVNSWKTFEFIIVLKLNINYILIYDFETEKTYILELDQILSINVSLHLTT